MRSLFKRSTCLAVALAAAAAGTAVAQSGLMNERFGLGLKARTDSPAVPIEGTLQGIEFAQAREPARSNEFALIGGVRDAPRLGLHAVESYGGVTYTSRGGWGSSLGAGFAQDTPESARRYSLGGQMHTALSKGRSLSVGLKYSVFDTDSASRPGPWTDGPGAQAYTLGAAFGPSYQLQMSYQHSSSSAFGLALGREIETFTPYLDTSSPSRQLTFMGQHWLTPSWALSYDVLTSDPANPMRFQGVGLRLGVRYRF